jgi:hypothetical protein
MAPSSLLRAEVVLFDGHEFRVLLWVREDAEAIRSGLAVPGADYHVSSYRAKGSHIGGKVDRAGAELSMAALVARHAAPRVIGNEQIAAYVFNDIPGDFNKLQLYVPGQCQGTVVCLDLASLGDPLTIQVWAADRHNTYLPAMRGEATLVSVDQSKEPFIVICIEGLRAGNES